MIFFLRFLIKISDLRVMGFPSQDIASEVRIITAINIDGAPWIEISADKDDILVCRLRKTVKCFKMSRYKNEIILLIIIEHEVPQKIFLIFRFYDQLIFQSGFLKHLTKVSKIDLIVSFFDQSTGIV